MSDEDQFQSADKLCEMEVVNSMQTYGYSLTPRKRVMENNLHWKFEKIKRIAPVAISPRKPDTKNISFQTDNLEEYSDEEHSCDSVQRVSAFEGYYKKNSQVYKKERAIGTYWLANKQYFASIFVDPQKLAKNDLVMFKESPQPSIIPKDQCIFDSGFQSGNLFAVYQIQKNEYDLILQNDVNSKGNTQWFYFQMQGLPAKTKIKINIVNMLKADSLFNYGMQPCIHSAQAYKKSGQGWFRSGSNIKYFRNNQKVDGSNRYYYTLTFTIATPYEGDVLRIAQCYPYTVQDLNQYLENVQKKSNKKAMIKRQSAGLTVGKNNIEVLRIQEQNPRKKNMRSLIFVTARQHPGETPGSFVCEGFIDYILSDQKEAQFLRRNYEIVFLPMLNPDGVIVGNYRTNLCGLDLNRRWDGSKPKQALQSICVKRYIADLSKNRQIAFIIDLHGHSRKLFSFFYGNTGFQTPEQVRIYPYICAKTSDSMIRFEDSTFACEQAKRRTARIQMFTKFKITNIFTFESSFFGYINKNRQKVHYTPQKFMSMGAVLAKSIFMHQRYKGFPESLEAVMVKKYIQQLRNKPELITCGDKEGSGSESEPEKAEVKDLEFQTLVDEEDSKQSRQKNGKNSKKISKKDIIIKDMSKQSRQLHVMDIARVNSIFPNDILALMPSSMSRKSTEREKLVVNSCSVGVQTEEMPLIKIYDICKFTENISQKKEESVKKKIVIKKQGEISNISKSNLFRTIIRPKSSSNSYLELNIKSTPKKQPRKRHESGYEIKPKSVAQTKKKVHCITQTSISFPPATDFMAQTLDSLIISPVSKNLDSLRNRSKFATLNPPIESLSEAKRSSQSFKIGLRALNVQTWRIRKKNFQ